MKHSHDHNFLEQLDNLGLKKTELRLAVLKILGEAKSPLSADEISQKLKRMSFDRATLFRTLKTFSEKNLISSIDLGEGCQRYEINCVTHHHHHHIICSQCKKIEIVPFCIPNEFKDFLTGRGYQEITHRMDFSGICKICYKS
jgi:Fur family transcriptional regulator, ferric uptake regulator